VLVARERAVLGPQLVELGLVVRDSA